ncbi:MAG: RtcB family protein [Streptosporangiaceae bacterium]
MALRVTWSGARTMVRWRTPIRLRSARAPSTVGCIRSAALARANHFLEVQAVEEIYDQVAAGCFGLALGQVCVMIHCGSRGLGHQICSDHVQIMGKAMGSATRCCPMVRQVSRGRKSRCASSWSSGLGVRGGMASRSRGSCYARRPSWPS